MAQRVARVRPHRRDTPWRMQRMHPCGWQGEAVAAIKGRTPRQLTTPTVVLQARVQPETRSKAHDAARALGISVAAYVERLIQQDELTEDGRPMWWPEEPQPGQLPLAG